MLWRLVACDLLGHALGVLSSARQRRFQFRLGQPASLEFEVPSDAADVAAVASDGQPVLSCLDRVVRAYRYEPAAGLWVLRFAGRVWQLTDGGDDADVTTRASAFDPLQMLAVRNARHSDGTDAVVTFTATDGAQILKALVDRTNQFKGPTGLATTGTFATTPARTVRYERKPISEAMTELIGANAGFDVQLAYLDGRTDGVLAELSVVQSLGSTRQAPRLGFGAPPHNVARLDRQQDGTRAENDVTALGTTAAGANLTSAQKNAGSVGRFGPLEGAPSYPDVTDQAYLDAQAQGDLQLYGYPVETVQLELVEDAVVPWVDAAGVATFGLGDRLPLALGPRVRGGSQTTPRVQGFDLDVSDEGVEQVTSLYMAAA